MKEKFRLAAIGGTFDRLHKGHRRFISRAFEIGEKVLIGMTSDIYANNKLSVVSYQSPGIHSGSVKVNSFEKRKIELEIFLKGKDWGKRARIVKIDDVYGGADKDSELEAIVVTPDSKKGADLINGRRKANGLKLLEVVMVDFERDTEGGIISSTRIRNGEMDREGNLYRRLGLWGGSIPKDLRIRLKEPIGELIPNCSKDPGKIGGKLISAIKEYRPVMLFTVGDEVTKLANSMGLNPDLAVFDFYVKRVEKYRNIQDLGIMNHESGIKGKMLNYPEVNNPPGSITRNLVVEIGKAVAKFCSLRQRSIIKINGEDDLAGLPAILLAPFGSMLMYGQPDEGVVLVKVEEEVKGKLMEIIGMMQD